MAKSVWVVDPSHSLVEFTVRHLMIARVKGRFTQFEGRIEADPENIPEATIEGTVTAASINTADEARDNHLRSADFFDVEHYPNLTFRSTRIERHGDGYKMTGDMTIRGVTRPVTFDLEYLGTAKDPWGNEKIGFAATAKINRKDFGLTWNAVLETGGVLVGDEVRIELQIEAAKQA
ncbi:MAG: YceI family protein [Symbiobacterium sp.]|uniref:YceI family protein n=1 Tax=Symbiobacterium sp. TaxID=1971213 RepID=UPI003464A11B